MLHTGAGQRPLPIELKEALQGLPIGYTMEASDDRARHRQVANLWHAATAEVNLRRIMATWQSHHTPWQLNPLGASKLDQLQSLYEFDGFDNFVNFYNFDD